MSATASNEEFCRLFYRQVRDEPVSPTDPRYEDFYASPEFAPEDPVSSIAFEIENSGSESTQLLSGYRGTGKSTELRRLRQYLGEGDHHVVLIDMVDHYNMRSPVEITDFLLTVAGAFGDALADETSGMLRKNPAHQGYFERFQSFLKTLQLDSASIGMSMGSRPLDFSAQLKFNLKTNSAFKEALQRRLRTSTAAFVEHVRGYFRDCLTLIGKQLGADLPVVVIVDSLEHLRGELAAEEQVQQSVATLFSSNVAALRMPQLHMIYTVPLYLRIREPAVVQQYGSRFHFLPAISLWERGSRRRAAAAFDVCERVVARRGDWLRLLGHRDVLDELVGFSGGHIRDLLRLLAEVAKRGAFHRNSSGLLELPVSPTVVSSAVRQHQSELLPIPDEDVLWLDSIRASNEAGIPDIARLPAFSRLVDNHLAVGYRGELGEWYDVHPLITKFVAERAVVYRATRRNIP